MAKRHTHSLFKRLATGAAVAGAMAAGVFVAAPAANAVPWSSNVHLQGPVSCPGIGGPYDHVWGMRWDGNNGDHVSVTNFGPNGWRRSYSLDVGSVPSGRPESFNVSTYCSVTGWHSQRIDVSRPWASYTASINVVY